jgi:hypothetical protein
MVWSKSTEINSNYIKPNRDTLILNSSMVNPENHQASVFARLKSETGSIKDSIQLFDDGLHNDAEASDNLWGGSSLLSDFEEGMFRMDLFINDLTTGTSYVHPEVSLFTTAGPIEFGSTDIDTLSDGRIALKNFVLVNKGIKMTVENIEAELTTLDTNLKFSLSSKFFSDIPAGGSKSIAAAYAFFAPEDNQLIKFEIKIKSNDKEYWTDSLIIDIANLTDIENDPTVILKEFFLEQNYPNPFNPSTTIKYQLPLDLAYRQTVAKRETKNVKLVVYDILGRQVATLVNEKQRPGNYEVEFDASTSSATGKELTSGIYFYQLQTGKYLETKKMLMIK